MSSCRSLALMTMLLAQGLAPWSASAQAARFDGVGRTATPAEVRAWDIDVRADFKGLPPGRGSVTQGQKVWEAQCAGCHGVFGESNEVFTPIAGGTTAKDIASGRVANLRDGNYPQRTTMMKLSSLSTLWDYIYRAMPWTAPKTLTHDEVYAVTAYVLHLADVLPADGELSDRNVREVQDRLPNRHGKTTAHAMWPGTLAGQTRRPDVQGSACMAHCPTEGAVSSYLPDHARNAHGNLALQQRTVGPQRGAVTEKPAAPAAPQALAQAQAVPVGELLKKNVCLACHQMEAKAVGPSFKDVAARHAGASNAAQAQARLVERIRRGGVGQWGAIPMPPQAIGEAEAQAIAAWLLGGAKP
jgi:S-disulfanyl-L-cysteine oxidoreductase SoxD